MADQLVLPNGNTFSKFYGGSLVNEEKLAAYTHLTRSMYVGPFCWVREYINSDYETISKTKFVKVINLGADLYTLCGYYKISGPYASKYGPQWNVYKCSTWRDSLKSTFGDYASCNQRNLTMYDAVLQLETITNP